MALALGRPGVKQFLQTAPLMAAGHISYSLYLTHMIVMPMVFYHLYGTVPLPALFGVNVALSLAVAAIFYYVVEKPCLTLSRWFGQLPMRMSVQEKLAA